jgi:hypothetical protein
VRRCPLRRKLYRRCQCGCQRPLVPFCLAQNPFRVPTDDEIFKMREHEHEYAQRCSSRAYETLARSGYAFAG